MPEDFTPMPETDIDKYFPLKRDRLGDAHTYEIALALGGTVSAGAYTAGVLDFLFEALDVWQRAKDTGAAEAPTHSAVVSAMAGASGGAINGSIAIRVAGWEFPHGPVAGNPFYDLWVNGVDMAKLLSPEEKPGSTLGAIFNTEAFSKLADTLIKTSGQPLGTSPASPKQRRYLGDPLRLSTMVANLTGVPYEIGFRGETALGHQLIAHADAVRFSATIDGGVPNIPESRPDDIALGYGSDLNWSLLKDSALATSAFPLAFPSRSLERTPASYAARVVAIPGDGTTEARVLQLMPRWDEIADPGAPPNTFRTVNVDGGTFNNEPIDHARIALAGYAGHNPRTGLEAYRGVVLVDPFSDLDAISLFTPPSLLGLLGPLVSALTQQARYKPEDIALANDVDTYSRFLVAPFGPGTGTVPQAGKKYIASGGLGGFIGFVDRAFLDYDFRLGRRNAYDFLKNEFVLPSDNPIFADQWSDAQKEVHRVVDTVNGKTTEYLPIIPMMADLRANPPELKPWPNLAKAPDYAKLVSARLDLLYDQLKRAGREAKWWPGTIGSFAADVAWKTVIRGTLRDAFLKTITNGLVDQKLLAKPPS